MLQDSEGRVLIHSFHLSDGGWTVPTTGSTSGSLCMVTPVSLRVITEQSPAVTEQHSGGTSAVLLGLPRAPSPKRAFKLLSWGLSCLSKVRPSNVPSFTSEESGFLKRCPCDEG